MYLRKIISPIALFLLVSGCVAQQPQSIQNSQVIPENKKACAYYNFLQGHRAELDNEPEDALDAYSRALECDPDSELLKTKIPLMLIRAGKFDAAINNIEKTLQEKPDQKGLSLLLASLYTQQGEEEKAVALYSSILNQYPNDTATLLRLGILYLERGQDKLAEKSFVAVLKQNPDSYYAHLYLAHTYYALNNIKAIEKHYKEALRINWSTQLCYEIAEFYFKNRKYSKALNFYDQILNYDRGENQAFFYKIQTLAKLKRYQQAYKSLDNRRNYSTHPEDIELTIATLLLDEGKTKKAIEKLTDISVNYPTGRAAHALAVIYYNEKEFANAHNWIEKIPVDSPLYDQGILLKLQMYVEEKHYTKGIELLKTQLETEDIDPSLYTMLASLYINNGDKEQAEESYKLGLATFPANETISYDYALFLYKEERIDEALLIMEAVLIDNPDSPQALNFVGYTWADNYINLEKALEYTTRAAELKPENGYIRDSVGWCYYRLGDYQRAVVELELAAHLAPKDPHIQEHLADAYLANEQFYQAYETYLIALKLHREDYKKEQVQKKIDELKPLL